MVWQKRFLYDSNARDNGEVFKLIFKKMGNKKTLVLGASQNPARYSYLALKRLSAKNYPVVAIGKSPGKVDSIEIATAQKPINDLDTITLYLNPNNQKQYYDYILA